MDRETTARLCTSTSSSFVGPCGLGTRELRSWYQPPASISFYVFNMPKNSKTVRKNPKKYAQKYPQKHPPHPPKNPQKNSTQPKIPHTKNENKKKLKRKKGAPK